jgi:hypothetical protein
MSWFIALLFLDTQISSQGVIGQMFNISLSEPEFSSSYFSLHPPHLSHTYTFNDQTNKGYIWFFFPNFDTFKDGSYIRGPMWLFT